MHVESKSVWLQHVRLGVAVTLVTLLTFFLVGCQSPRITLIQGTDIYFETNKVGEVVFCITESGFYKLSELQVDVK